MIQKNIPLAPHTTFGIGGPAKFFVEVKTQEELLTTIEFAKTNKLTIFILGGGSNVLMSDDGHDGLVIKTANDNFASQEGTITAGAGLNWDNLVQYAVSKNLQGIECLSGIPGSVGAAPVQNIGAYGQEIKDTFVSLVAYDLEKSTFVTMHKTDCAFDYRDSTFKSPKNKGRYIIWEVSLKLIPGGTPTLVYESLKNYLADKGITNPSLQEVREAVLTLRKGNHIDPRDAGNAGSFFKNPIITKNIFEKIKADFPSIPSFETTDGKVKLFAGWLIEQTGWKGKTHKNASVSPKHALVLINPNHKAKAKEVKELANLIEKDVFDWFKIKLEKEVQII